MWSIEMFTVVGLTFLAAGTVKGVIGMALPTVSLGVLAATLGLKEAIVLMLVPSFVTNVWQGFAGTHLLPLIRRLWTLLLTILVGAWLGTAALKMSDTVILEILLGVTLFLYGIFGLLTPTMPLAGRHEAWLSPLIGGSSGVLAGLTGSTVLPVTPYLQTLKLSRDEFIQAMGICFSTAALGIWFGLMWRNLLPRDLGFLSITGVIPAVVGMYFGKKIRQHLSEQLFKKVFFVSVSVLGTYISIRANIV